MKERKNFWCQPMCSSFFSEEEVKALPVRFSSEFVGFHFRFWATNSIRTLVVFCVAQAEPSTFQTKKIAAQKERARALFEFVFFVCLFATVRADNFYARAHSLTHTRGKSDETLVEICRYTFCARARSLSVRKFKPVTVLFFFQTITF